MATDEEYRARCVLQAKINELEDRLEQSNAQLGHCRAALQSIVDDYEFTSGDDTNGDRGGAYAETARTALRALETKNSCPKCGKPYTGACHCESCCPTLMEKNSEQ